MENLAGQNDTGSVLPKDRLSVYVAEYAALMQRNTNLMTVQYSIFPLASLFCGFVASNWDKFEKMKVPAQIPLWGCLLFINLIIIVWNNSGFEVYNNVRYIQTDLKPRIAGLIRDSEFWRYEDYLFAQRGRNKIWYDWVSSVCSLALFGLLWYLRWSAFTWGDWIGVSFVVASFGFVGYHVLRLLRARSDMHLPLKK